MRKFIIATLAAAGLSGLATVQASAHERWFEVVNQSDQTILAVRASNIDVSWWGRDLLGEDVVIRPGRSLIVEPVRHQGYCRFDIKIDFVDGNSQTISNVNLCKATEVVTYGQIGARYVHNVAY